MTPTATTPAARRGAKAKSASGESGRAASGVIARPAAGISPRPVAAPGHRRAVRPAPAPRRVSGPVRGRSASAGATKRAPAPRVARRRSGARAEASFLPRAVAFVRGLPDHGLLDRLIRGRAWIPVLGVMLAGIVAMQVEVLKLGATMGRAIERGTALQSRNELLRDSVASLQDEQRIVRLASGLGMVMPAPGGIGFLSASSANADKAATDIKAPDAALFSSLLTSNGALAATPTAPTSASSTSTSVAPAASAPGAVSATPATPSTPSTTSSASPSGIVAPGGSTPVGPVTSSPQATGTGATSSGTPQTTPSTGTGAATAAATGGGAAVTGG